MERFNGYLKASVITPLAATLKSAGLKRDVETAKAQIGPWLEEVAHQLIGWIRPIAESVLDCKT